MLDRSVPSVENPYVPVPQVFFPRTRYQEPATGRRNQLILFRRWLSRREADLASGCCRRESRQ